MSKESGAAAIGARRTIMPPLPDAQWWLRSASVLAFALVFTGFALTSPLFLTLANLANIVQQSAVVGILACGLTVVLIGGGADPIRGGLDLSVAANLGFCSAVYAVSLRSGAAPLAALALTLSAGAAVGLLNAFAVVVLRIYPLLATLTTMNLCAGLELVLTENTSVAASTPLLAYLLREGPFSIPNLASVFIAVAAVFAIVLHATPFGLRLHAAGAHPDAARAAQLRTGRYVAASYVLSAIAAAFASIANTALLSGSSPGAGSNLLTVVAAALLGVIFSRRLVPSIPGTLLAVFFIGVIGNGFQLDNVSSDWVNGVEGVLILIVVAATAIVRRRHAAAHAYD